MVALVGHVRRRLDVEVGLDADAVHDHAAVEQALEHVVDGVALGRDVVVVVVVEQLGVGIGGARRLERLGDVAARR